jgi:molecular chaperone DnaK (HSP70)
MAAKGETTVRIGIDFGTTNTVVALADRGNFPVLELDPEESGNPAIPSVIGWGERGEFSSGTAAIEAARKGSGHILPSFKRWLGHLEPPPGFALGRLEGCLADFLGRVREAVVAAAGFDEETRIEAAVGVPANANSLQRWRTLQAVREAGFDPLGLVHEPTAAALEYAHRHPLFGKGRSLRHVLVYDLGGGTFDASLVRLDPEGVAVILSTGVDRLGGDDFDRILADLVLESTGSRFEELGESDRLELLARCRDAKEAIRPTTRKWIVDLAGVTDGEVTVRAADYAERCLPLVERSVSVLEELLRESQLAEDEIDALLLVGGGSELPLVRKKLTELFATRVRISPHPFASTAIGLAIHADRKGPAARVEERLSRHFGVWREAEAGTRKTFDVLFDRSTPLPLPGELHTVTRTYRPVHDVGVFRFEECLELDSNNLPTKDRTPWCEILFPFDPHRSVDGESSLLEVHRRNFPEDLVATETWSCDSEGMISVRIERSNPPLATNHLLFGPEKLEPLPARSRPAEPRKTKRGARLSENALRASSESRSERDDDLVPSADR